MKNKDGGWKVNYRYKADGYTVFDMGNKPSERVTYIIHKTIH